MIAAFTLAPKPVAAETPTAILARAPDTDWRQADLNDLLVIDLARGGHVVIQLDDAFAPVHVANIRKLARAHWYDGLSIERVQDGYVVQWGDPDNTKPLPPGITKPVPAEYDRAAAGLHLDVLPYKDTFATVVGFVDGWPAAEGDDKAWLVHCYGMVGVGRDINPDTGTGAELYAVIGQAPRALDRNIALVGRVLGGMDVLAALTRGNGDLGFYTDPSQRDPIKQARIAADLPKAEQPHYQLLKTSSPSFQAWMHARANRQDNFFLRPAGAVDVCNAMPPIRDKGAR